MLADPNHARRPALPRARRRLMAALLCAPLLLWPILAGSGPAALAATGSTATSVPTATDADAVSLALSPSGSSILHIDQPLQLTVTVTNDSATAIPTGTVDVFLAE